MHEEHVYFRIISTIIVKKVIKLRMWIDKFT